MRKISLFGVLILIFISPFVVRGEDFDGDGTDDPAVFRPSSGLWAVRGITRFYFGSAGDYPVPLNYSISSTSNPAIFRPDTGLWAVRGTTRIYFGGRGDSPLRGDFNGDGLDEIGIFRASTGLWAIRNRTRLYFGSGTDIPVPGDFNGDGTAAAAVFRLGSGLWAIRGLTRTYFGNSADLPMPADYDGDGTREIGIYRSGSGLWAARGLTRVYFGGDVDLPQPFDFLGNGTDEVAVFRPHSGLWAVRGISRIYYGGSGDIPVTAPGYWSPSDLPRFGVVVIRRHSDQAHLDKLEESGAEATGFGYLSWRRLEPENTDPKNFRWEEYDSWLANYAPRGLTPIVSISDIPSWAGQTVSGPFEPSARDDFAEFVGAVVRRYSQPPYNIKYWEFFNEPDGTQPIYGAGITTWGYFGDEYALMLQSAYPALKAADPDSQLVFGGLAYDNFVKDGGNFYKGFLSDVLAAGGGDYFDLFNFHYYYFARETWGNITGKLTDLKKIFAWYGVSKPMICNEVGIWGFDEPYYLGLQARYLPKVFVRGLSAALEAVLWFPLATEEGHTFEGGLLREEDLSEKPAFLSCQVLISQLKNYRYQWKMETGSANLEGYKFSAVSGDAGKWVIWAEEDTSGAVTLAEEQIRVVAIDGTSRIINDGGAGDRDGLNNGQIRLGITSSPVYVEPW